MGQPRPWARTQGLLDECGFFARCPMAGGKSRATAEAEAENGDRAGIKSSDVKGEASLEARPG